MPRWHHSSCDTPSVSIKDGLPHCQSCNQSPDLAKLVAEQDKASPPWAIPPDEKPGELRLHWPASVTFKSSNQTTVDGSSITKHEPRNVFSANSADTSMTSPIYEKRLSPTEFRILSISPAADERCPIHVMLRDYRLDDCPEYETVSYCWGGEDGDSKRYSPVYLGDYWDVLLQTKNCWSMLQYMRLQSHARLVWVDAICINQEDNLEKEIQVPLMGTIYWRCLRVIVYLGEDIVKAKEPSVTKGRSYPPRHDFTEFGDVIPGSLMTLQQLFKLKYFQRVWVIQELIRAPAAVIPAHGNLFMVRPPPHREPRRMQTSLNGPQYSWAQYACTGAISESLSLRMQQTWASQATDPRDKVHGLLGLGAYIEGFRPDYSISLRSTYIGTVLHLLVNDTTIELLIEGVGQLADSRSPSWLPDWNLHNIGRQLLFLSNAASNDYEKDIESHMTRFGHDGQILVNWSDMSSEKTGLSAQELWGFQKPSVDPSTLKLTLSLIHICEFKSGVAQVYRPDRNEPLCIFEIKVANCNLYIWAPNPGLSIEPGNNELFILKKSGGLALALFMERLAGNKEYRLLKCCFCFNLLLSKKPSSSYSSVKMDGDEWENKNYLLSEGSLLYGTVAKALGKINQDLGRTGWDQRWSWEYHGMTQSPVFQNPPDPTGVPFGVFQVVYQMVCDPDSSFLTPFVDFVLHHWPRCSARAKEGLVCMELNPNNFKVALEALGGPSYYALEIEVYAPLGNDPSNSWGWQSGKLHAGNRTNGHLARASIRSFEELFVSQVSQNVDVMDMNMKMRVRARHLRAYLERSDYYDIASKKLTCDRILRNGESILGSEGPWNTSDSFCYFDWPESFYKDGQQPGRVRQVTIV
ncbi:HET-domain-containing protein [Fusarium austroafricanum]|uniref:HET-domain-containing protein n=1 Tax=Fusarium austroafricanum TaxID=2364996 RepID=A0A8H4NP42_9HYPO|nr:HET-domain-containing protein [Fusarium austroafricanum]